MPILIQTNRTFAFSGLHIFIVRCLCSTSYKDVGLLYFLFGLLAGVADTLLSILIRLELSTPSATCLPDNSRKSVKLSMFPIIFLAVSWPSSSTWLTIGAIMLLALSVFLFTAGFMFWYVPEATKAPLVMIFVLFSFFLLDGYFNYEDFRFTVCICFLVSAVVGSAFISADFSLPRARSTPASAFFPPGSFYYELFEASLISFVVIFLWHVYNSACVKALTDVVFDLLTYFNLVDRSALPRSPATVPPTPSAPVVRPLPFEDEFAAFGASLHRWLDAYGSICLHILLNLFLGGICAMLLHGMLLGWYLPSSPLALAIYLAVVGIFTTIETLNDPTRVRILFLVVFLLCMFVLMPHCFAVDKHYKPMYGTTDEKFDYLRPNDEVNERYQAFLLVFLVFVLWYFYHSYAASLLLECFQYVQNAVSSLFIKEEPPALPPIEQPQPIKIEEPAEKLTETKQKPASPEKTKTAIIVGGVLVVAGFIIWIIFGRK